jgi:hypothetical protein
MMEKYVEVKLIESKTDEKVMAEVSLIPAFLKLYSKERTPMRFKN